jgi:glutamine synthetase adenylyltransferase
MQSLVEGVEFRDPSRARDALIRLRVGMPERIAARIQMLLASVPDPDTSIRCLERLRHDAPSAFERITSSPAALRCAVNIFSYSHFLTESVLQNPERILQVANSGSLYRVLAVEEYEERLFDFLGPDQRGVPSGEVLARFRRRQLLRIVERDVLGIATL